MEQMKNLVDKLNQASFAYYNSDDELISDYEYDKLYDELINLEKKLNVILPDSPTQKVGAKISNALKKVVHEKKMLSLDKTKSIDKLKEFLTDKIGLLSWKLDGLTIVLIYDSGNLRQIITRGNGEIGEDITHNASIFTNLPKKISYTKKLIVRGEAVISYENFNAINENFKYKNPRNLCSGTVRNLIPQTNRPVHFFAFDLVLSKDIDFKNSKMQKLLWLKNLGFDVVEFKITDAQKIFDDVADFKSRVKNFGFAADGLVLTLDDIAYSKFLGVTNKFPRDSIAFKWADETKTTKLLDIEWNTSRTGLINPIAIFEPIELDGTKINKASLHNINFINNLELGIGDTIKVYKANMIIPQIADNLTRSNNAQIPKKCPVCHHNTEIIQINSGKFLYCVNPNCSAKLIMSLVHFASRDAMNIEGLSEMIIKKFVAHGFLKNYTDIYELKKYEQEIKFYQVLDSKSPNKNHKLYTNLMTAIEKSKNVFLYNLIYALGINRVGLSNAKSLCMEFNNDIEKIKSATFDEINNIHGFGSAIAKSVCEYFSDIENIELLDKILPILNFKSVTVTDDKILNGLSFVITGDLEKFKNRKEFINFIEMLGGKVSSSVSKKTTALINNNLSSKSEKNQKAITLGIPIITEENFIKNYDLKI